MSKFKNPFKFGDKVKISAILTRFTDRSDLSNIRRYWQRENCNLTGLYLGYRNLYSGTIDSMPDDEGFITYLRTTSTHRAALVAIKNKKPCYVLLEDIEKIDEIS